MSSVAKKCLILYCSKDDADKEMSRLAELLAEKKTSNGHTVSLISFDEYKEGSDKYDELCFVGHSRFYDQMRKVIPVGERTIGGYKLGEIFPIIEDAIKKKKISSIKAYACESASNSETERRDDGTKSKVQFQFEPRQNRLKSYLRNKAHEMISTLEAITIFVSSVLKVTHNCRPFKVQGIEGYGYYTPDNLKTRSFHSKYLHELDKITKLEADLATEIHPRNRSTMKKQIQTLLSDFVERRINNKGPAHKIQYLIN